MFESYCRSEVPNSSKWALIRTYKQKFTMILLYRNTLRSYIIVLHVCDQPLIPCSPQYGSQLSFCSFHFADKVVVFRGVLSWRRRAGLWTNRTHTNLSSFCVHSSRTTLPVFTKTVHPVCSRGRVLGADHSHALF